MKRLRILRRWLARRFGLARALCLLILVGFALLRLGDPVPLRELRVRTFDTFQLIDPRVKKVKPVTIVDIDEKSLATLGQWPWPRSIMADIVADLTRLGAVVIAFDVMFPEPDRLNPDVAARTMRYLDEATRAKLRELPSNDQILADAIRHSRVVLGETGLGEARSEPDDSLPLTGMATIGEDVDPLQFVFQFPGLLRNVPPIEKAAAGRGLLTIVPERDGIIRRVPMVLRAQGNPMPSLSLEILRVVTGTPTILIKSDKAGIQSIKLKGIEIPTDSHGQLWIHFARQDRERSMYVSAADVLAGSAPVDKIKGKLVLIGTSAVGLSDIKTTPVSPSMPGVEIHAQVLESALTGGVVSQPNYGFGLEFFAAMIAGLLIIAFAPNLGPARLVAVGALFATILVGSSWYFYRSHHLLIDFTYPLMSTTAIYLTLIFSSFVREQAQRRQIRSAFGQYLSPAFVEQLAQSPEKLKLGGEAREITIMFSDMRGFTSISETYK
ncbi:MAG: CHASE2 domain-containing protein, partial [Bradyrhizobium sp.]